MKTIVKEFPSPKVSALKELQKIPGVGKSIANDLWNIGITSIIDLIDRDPEKLYNESNKLVGVLQDRCLLYVFRCAVYFASNEKHEKSKLLWWNWTDEKCNM